MKNLFIPFQRLLVLLVTLLLFYSTFRLFFVCSNLTSFPDLSANALFGLLFKGIRFDLSAIFLINLIFIVLLLLPFGFTQKKAYNRLLKWVFIIPNSLFFLFEIADWKYYQFNHKRSTAEVLDLIGNKGDFLNLLPSFLKDYWYLFFIALFILIAFIKTYNHISLYFLRKSALNQLFSTQKSSFKKRINIQTLILIITVGLSVIGARGGLQYVPISVRNAISMTKSEYTPIVLNTPFCILKTFSKTPLEQLDYFPLDEALSYFHPIKNYSEQKTFEEKNIVFIILESFSKEFTKLTNGPSYTPFLDSLMDHALTFTNAYANGLHSAAGIPAILAGIPALTDEPYTFTAYNNNKIDALPNLLKNKGYQTAFYHGGTDGTMGFDNFANAAGFDKYFGRNAYNNSKDYDGNWGIFDEPFLQYFAKGLDTLKSPFMASVFTLTSHPPFPLPEKYKDHFPKGELDIHPTIGYTDMAIQKFFDYAQQTDWYSNTVFVIVPDHCSPLASNAFYSWGTGRYQIPIIFFAPGDQNLKGYDSTLIQQIDILPSLMDYLSFPDSFFAFGSSIFRDTEEHFVINKRGDAYQWMHGDYLSMFYNQQFKEVYDFPTDSMRTNDLTNQEGFQIPNHSKNLFLSFIQIYNKVLPANATTVENFNRLYRQEKKNNVSKAD